MASRYNVRSPITLLDSGYSFKADEDELILDSNDKSLLFKQSDVQYNDLYDKFKGTIIDTFGASGGSDPVGDNWIYEETDTHIILKRYIGSSANVRVPAIVYGKPTKISNRAFTSSDHKNGILSITFDNDCTADTMESMFSDLASLKSVSNLPDSDSYANTFKNTSIQTAIIPNGVVNAANAFYGCTKLEGVQIPNTIANMSNMYRGCVNLTEQYNSESAEDMDYAYYGCKKIDSFVTIPNSVTSMVSTYDGCYNIYGNMHIMSDDIISMNGCFANTNSEKNKYIYANQGSLTEEAVKDIDGVNGVKLVRSSNFWDEDEWEYEPGEDTYTLTKYTGNAVNVVIPSVINSRSVVINGTNMFANNPNVQTVRFEDDSIKYFGNTVRYMFRNCPNLVSVPDLQEGLTDMSYIYYGCQSLQNVPAIPNSISNIQFSYAYTDIREVPTIPTTVDSLYFTFAGSKIKSFPEITNNIKNIAYAFAEAQQLTGDIYIHAEDFPVSAMRNCFLNTSKEKNVYIPYINNGNSYANTMAAAYHNSFGIFDRCGVTVYYDSGAWNSSDWEYDEDDTGITLRRYIGNNPNAIVPGCIDNKKVFSNGRLFSENGIIQSVKYEPGSYISNMTEDFFSCTNLREVGNLPYYANNLTNAFAECRQLTTLPDLHEGVEIIAGICRNCVSMVTLPNVPTSVTQMSYAFYGTEISRGDVYIKSRQIANAHIYASFGGESLYTRRVHVPARGINATHNTAAAAFNDVYGIDGKNNVSVITDL